MELKKIKEIFSFEKGSLQSLKCTAGDYNFITASSGWKTHNSFDYECEALIVAVAASGSLGRVHYVNGKFISSDLCFVLKPKDSINLPVNLEFYYSIIKSLKEDLVKSTATGTAKKSINKTNFGNYRIPYYSIKEQNRLKPIFEKVADNLEKINYELSNQKQLISKLKQAILQEAIQGKLTQEWRKQNPNTEPASELLERIEAEKKRLIKDNKIRKEKPLAPITEEEIPFKIPENWTWVKLLGLCSKTGSGSTPKGGKSAYIESGIKFIRSQNVYDNGLRTKDIAYISNEVHKKMKGTKVESEDLLLNITGGSIGRCCIVPSNFDTGNINQHVAIIRSIDKNLSYFLHKIICSSYFQKTIIEVQTGAGREGLPKNKMDEILIPLPPETERKIIVEKIDNLMHSYDSLELEIIQNEQHANMLMQAVLKEAFQN